VSLDSSKGRWKCEVHIDGRNKHLGYFASEEEAARRHDDAALALGKLHSLNFPDDVSPILTSKHDHYLLKS